jgi:hypothetical protein
MLDGAPSILALDVASRTGAAWGTVGATPRSLSIKFTREGEASSMDGVGEASARAIRWLAEFTAVERFDRAVIEAPVPEAALGHQTNAWATALKFALIGSLSGALKLRSIPVAFANIQAVRKLFIGKGNVRGEIAKPEVMRICGALGWTPDNTDEGDAMACWLFECSRVSPRLAHRCDPISLGITPTTFERTRIKAVDARALFKPVRA